MPTPLKGMPIETLRFELEQGGKVIAYQYCISVLVLSFKRFSGTYLVKAGEGSVGPAIPWVLLSLVGGWWGIPWGPIWTIQSLWVNLRGGKDLTAEVRARLGAPTTLAGAAAAAAAATATAGAR